MEQYSVVNQWLRYCDSMNIPKEGQAIKLGLDYTADYRFMIAGQREFPQDVLRKMIQIIEGKAILEKAVIKTKLLREVDQFVQRSLQDKCMLTLVSPTGQGKTFAAKYVAGQYGCKYYNVLTELQRKNIAATKNFVRDLTASYGFNPKSTNNLRNLITRLTSDTRMTLIIDEAQRLISVDWGYFKVIQDLLDNVPNLSIILLGNFRFYEAMHVDAERTYQGILDDEQFLRRISLVHKLPRITHTDVKLWCEYNNINMKTAEHKEIADFFGYRGGLADLENVRQDIVRLMGRSSLKSWKDINYRTLIALYKAGHKEIKISDEEQEAVNEAEKAA